MSDPAYALQVAVRAALGSGELGIGTPSRVYDRVPAEPVFPYVTIGRDAVDDDSNSCAAAWQCRVQVDVWSRAPGLPEAKLIAGRVRAVLATEIAVDGFLTVLGEHIDTTYLDDPDGVTIHAALRFRYLIDPAP